MGPEQASQLPLGPKQRKRRFGKLTRTPPAGAALRRALSCPGSVLGLQILQIPAAARVPCAHAQLRCISPQPGSLIHHKTALRSAPTHPTAPQTFPTPVAGVQGPSRGAAAVLCPQERARGRGGCPPAAHPTRTRPTGADLPGRVWSQRQGPHRPGCSSIRGGSGCFLAEPEAGGPRREEGAPQLPPGSSGHVQWLRSQAELSFPSGNNRIPFPFGRGASPPARACGWAAVSRDRPAGSRHPGGKENPEKHKNAAKELP